MSYHLIDVVQQLGHPRVLVLGDLILDRYVWGDAERVSQEAPVILLREEKQEARLGGAANVANMLRGLEAEATIAGAVGDDADGRCVRDELTAAGIGCASLIFDSGRPTTVKQRFIGRAQQRQRRRPTAARHTSPGLPSHVVRGGAYEAVTDYETVVEEGERLAGG